MLDDRSMQLAADAIVALFWLALLPFTLVLGSLFLAAREIKHLLHQPVVQ